MKHFTLRWTIAFRNRQSCARKIGENLCWNVAAATKLAKLFMVILYEESYSTLRIHSHVTKAVRPRQSSRARSVMVNVHKAGGWMVEKAIGPASWSVQSTASAIRPPLCLLPTTIKPVRRRGSFYYIAEWSKVSFMALDSSKTLRNIVHVPQRAVVLGIRNGTWAGSICTYR